MDVDGQDHNHSPLQIHLLSLQRFCMISIVSKCYERSNVLKGMKKSVLGQQTQLSDHKCDLACSESKMCLFLIHNYDAWPLISNMVKSLKLPYKMKEELTAVAIVIGQRIFDWMKYVIKVLKLNSSYIDKIYLTSNGFIDEAKIFEMYWLKKAGFCKIKKQIGTVKVLFSYINAFMFVQEDVIQNSKADIIQEIKKLLPSVNAKNVKLFTRDVFGIGLIYCFGENFDKYCGTKIYDQLLTSGDIDYQNVFRLSVFFGFLKVAKYFWDLLDEDNRINVLMLAAQDWVMREFYFSNKDTIRKVRCAEMFLFIINKMTEKQRFDFLFENYCVILRLFFVLWPYEGLCAKIWHEVSTKLPLISFKNILTLRNTAKILIEGVEENRCSFFLTLETREIITREAMEVANELPDANEILKQLEISGYE